MIQPYVIFFKGLNGLIDKDSAERLAKNRGCEAVFFDYEDWTKAAAYVASHPNVDYHVVGFSRGAASDVMGGLMSTVRKHNLQLPIDLMTIGLFTGTHRYVDPTYECINYLDSSSHPGHTSAEHNAVDLGVNVPHLDPVKGGMALVANQFGIKVAVKEDVSPQLVTQTILTKQNWPTQANAHAFYGAPGSHLTHVTCPWTLHMGKDIVKEITIHEKCAPSLTRVLNWVWETCGKDQQKIEALRYDRFSGSYNYRPMRGGSALSMHSYGAAIDWDDQDNAQHSHKHLFTAESPLIKAFLDEGWEWGGNWTGSSIDAMHVQAAHVR